MAKQQDDVYTDRHSQIATERHSHTHKVGVDMSCNALYCISLLRVSYGICIW